MQAVYGLPDRYTRTLRENRQCSLLLVFWLCIFTGFSRLGKCDSSGGKPPTLTLQQAVACLLSVLPSGSTAALRTERQRSLSLTPTHCICCCPFCHANRLRLNCCLYLCTGCFQCRRSQRCRVSLLHRPIPRRSWIRRAGALQRKLLTAAPDSPVATP